MLGNPQAQRTRQISAHWNALPGQIKADWNSVTGLVYNPTQPDLPTKQHGYHTFLSAANALLDANASLPNAAPAAYTPPAPLPACALSVQTDGAGTPRVTLHCPAGYAGTVVVSGTRPVPATRTPNKSATFVRLGAITNLAAARDLTGLVNTLFRIPGPGYQISIRLVAVSAEGFKSAPVIVAAVSALAPGPAFRL